MNRLNHVIGHLQPSKPQIEPSYCDKSEFEYTMSDKILTTKERQFYEENGYFVVRGLLKDKDVKKFYNRFDDLVANPSDGPPQMIIMRDISLEGLEKKDRKHERVVTKLQNWSYDRVLWEFTKHKDIIPYISSIIGDDIRGHHFMMINKPSDPGRLSSRHPLHQDQWYFPFAPSKYIVCAWTALQKVNRNNGCLCVVAGTHKMKLLPHSYPKQWHGPVNKAYHGIQIEGDINELLSKRIHLEMEPGDTVFFHPLLLHASGANLTDTNRRSISTHYCNSKLVDFVEGGVIPQQAVIANEIEALAQKMKGAKLSYADIWRAKSRQVQGDPGCFRFSSRKLTKK